MIASRRTHVEYPELVVDPGGGELDARVVAHECRQVTEGAAAEQSSRSPARSGSRTAVGWMCGPLPRPTRTTPSVAIREWARADGQRVSDRGRISRVVLEVCENRNHTPAP